MVNSLPGPISSPTELVRQAQRGDPNAQEALLLPYWTPVYRLARQWTGTAEDAEDLTQEIFVRTIRALPGYRCDAPFGGWLFRIALNTCKTARLRRKDPPKLLDEEAHPDARPTPEQRALRGELHERIATEVRRMHASYGEAVLLRLIAELTYDEVAETLGVSVETARLRVHRGLKQLRQRLGRELKRDIR